MRPRSFFAMSCLGAFLGWLGPLPAAEDLKIVFDDKGLASVAHNGVELMKPTDPRPGVEFWRFPDPNAKEGFRQLWGPKPKQSSFDAAKKSLLVEYDWGTLECRYVQKDARLDFEVAITNSSPDPISEGAVILAGLRVPNTPVNRPDWNRVADNVRVVGGDLYAHEKGVFALVNGDVKSGRGVNLSGPDSPENPVRRLRLAPVCPESKPHHPIVDDAFFRAPARLIEAGKTERYRISLVFGPPGATAMDLCPEIYDAYTQAHPMVLNWPDRRPIATAFLCNPATGWKTNPRGFIFGKGDKNNVTTEEGLKAFGEALLQYADNCIARMKAMDAQGIIIWDIEGQEMPHMISYIGDPRALPRICPEMDRFSDAFMKKFRDAGFKTGVTIRPTEVYQTDQPKGLPWNQREVKDPLAVMSEKIACAQKRWGCTIFYLDSNVFGDGLLSKEDKAKMKGVPWTMPIGMIEQLARKHSDCLIVPEWADRLYYTCSAPYSSANLGQLGTDPLSRRLWPQAFRVISISLGLLEAHWESYVEGVQGGDVLLFMPWWDPIENEMARLIYREAAFRRKGLSDALAKAETKALLERAKDASEEVRFSAAAAFARRQEAEALSALAGLLQDESPLVRRRALLSLAQAPKIEDPALIAKLAAWLKGGQDKVNNVLRAFAADVLAKGGDAAVPALLELLRQDNPGAWPGAWPYAIRALGRTRTSSSEAEDIVVTFLQAKSPDKKAEQRLAVIEAAGLLRARKAVPSLVQWLEDRKRDNEEVRGRAVVALGRIGDPKAVEALTKHWDVGYSTVVVYWISGALDDALASLTGQKEILGKDAWKRWWQKHRAEFEAKP